MLPSGAVHRRGGIDGTGDGARAVLNGQGGGLGDRVGLASQGELGSVRAVGGVGVNDLGGDGDVLGPGGVDTSNSGEDDSSSELHFVGWGGLKLGECLEKIRVGSLVCGKTNECD